MKRKEITIRSSAAEYLTFIAATGEIGKLLKYDMKTRIYGLLKKCYLPYIM